MAGTNPDGSNLLSELEAQLRAPDSIMEPGVLDLLKDYLRAGGKPSAAIEDLSENYEALHLLQSRFNELHAQQELVKERFEAAKFLGVFRKGHPDWLNELISDRRGRQLIYDLSAAHKNSLLLNYAIQRILKQGHQEEVSLVGGALASYFEVYHRLLATRLLAAVGSNSVRQLQDLAAEIADSCGSSQHTYVHAQQVLTAAAGWAGGEVLRRLSQEVEAAAVANHGGPKVFQLM
eukprot:gene12244-12381_t